LFIVGKKRELMKVQTEMDLPHHSLARNLEAPRINCNVKKAKVTG